MSRSESRKRMASSDPALEALVARTRGPQVGRRLFHAFCGLGYAWLIAGSGLGRDDLLLLLGGAAAAALLGDLARFAIPALNRLFFRVFRLFASPREREGVASSTWYAIGVLLVFVLLPPSLAACSVLVLVSGPHRLRRALARTPGGRARHGCRAVSLARRRQPGGAPRYRARPVDRDDAAVSLTLPHGRPGNFLAGPSAVARMTSGCHPNSDAHARTTRSLRAGPLLRSLRGARP
jgi:hypothetical protein